MAFGMISDFNSIEAPGSQQQARSAYQIVVIGAGPSGCAAAIAARASGAERVLLADLADGPGGALAAMGLWQEQDLQKSTPTDLQLSYQTSLLSMAAGLQLRLLSPRGLWHILARAVVLATGGREQTRGNLAIPGTRPAGVLTAGTALRLLTETGQKPARHVLIAGGGRWAHTTARQLEQAGASVATSDREVAQIEGWPRITGVVLADGRRETCDWLVLATPQQPWLAPSLAGAVALEGVFVAGAAAAAEIDAQTAAESGAAAGRQAAAWVAGQRMQDEG